MTNQHEGKYESLIALQNDAAMNSLWRSAADNIPRNSSSAITQSRGKAHVRMPSYKLSHGIIGRSCHGNHNNFGGNGSRGSSGNKLTWGHLKDAKAGFKSPLNSHNFDKK